MISQLAEGLGIRGGHEVENTASCSETVCEPAAAIRPQPLQSFHFSTAELPPDEQFEGWRASYAAALDLSPSDGTSEGFAGHHRVWDLGSLVLTQASTRSLSYAGLAGRARRDPLDHWLLTLLLSGRSVTEAGGGRQLAGEAGLVQMHPLGRPFEGHISDSELLLLFVPRDLCRDSTRILDAIAFTTLEGGMGRIFADYMVSMAQKLPLLKAADLPELVAVTRAMLLACAEPSPEHLEEADSTISGILLERARQYIQANLQDPELDSRKLQRVLGTSRSRLYRLFEASDGVMRYIQRRRLAAAYSALADPDDGRRIFEIAESCCLGDGAEFSRAFRREFGCSPSDIRASLRHGFPGPARQGLDAADAPSQRLNVLLRRLRG